MAEIEYNTKPQVIGSAPVLTTYYSGGCATIGRNMDGKIVIRYEGFPPSNSCKMELEEKFIASGY